MTPVLSVSWQFIILLETKDLEMLTDVDPNSV